jgi:predicted nucleotidyltransferase
MLNIEPRHLEIVKAILSKYNYEFYIFGSRITDKAKKFSDLDLFYKDIVI